MASSLKTPYRIADIGVAQALYALVPYVRSAGRLAAALQPAIATRADKTEKGGSPFASALTDADLLIEDRLGSDLFMLFSDASFHGEEHSNDRISRYIPDDRHFVITLDPINGTLYYRDCLPQYETIITVCDRAWNMVGAIVYRPALDEIFLGYDWNGQCRATRSVYQGETCILTEELSIPNIDAPKVVYLDRHYSDAEDLVRRAGYTPIFPWRDYAGQKDWPHASCNLLSGRCRGILQPRAPLIDSKAFGFIAECAGGIWKAGPLDTSTLLYDYGLSATNEDAAAVLKSLL